jgi:hypothetical protein
MVMSFMRERVGLPSARLRTWVREKVGRVARCHGSMGWWVCWVEWWRWPKLSRRRRGRCSGIRCWAFGCLFGGICLWETYWYAVHNEDHREWSFIASRRVRLHTEVWFSNWLNHTCENMTVEDIRYREFTHVT